jgi:antirestriction protein
MNELEQALEDYKTATPSAQQDTPLAEALIEQKTSDLFKQWVEENGSLDLEAYEGYADNLHLDLLEVEDWSKEADENYAGEFYNDEMFAESLLEEIEDLSNLPDIISGNIDWSGVAVDIMYDYFEVGGHYFRSV